MILPITIYGSSVLRKEAQDIYPSYPNLEDLIQDMKDTMIRAEGIGLAAPQVGKSIRLIVINAKVMGEDYPECEHLELTLINPEMIEESIEEVVIEEGCLSVPGIRGDVMRPESIKVRYCDSNFVVHEEEYHGFAARIIQHEMDHLEGKMFVDRISPLRRRMMQTQLNAMRKGKVNAKYKVKID